MNVSLLHRRPGRHRRFATVAPDPNACHCVVRHPVTDEERERVRDGILLALWAGNRDRADYLRTQLATICPAAMKQLLSRYGQQRTEDNEMRAA